MAEFLVTRLSRDASFSAPRCPPSYCVLVWPVLGVCSRRGKELSFFLFFEDLYSHWMRTPRFITSLILKDLVNVLPSANALPLGTRDATYEFGESAFRSIAPFIRGWPESPFTFFLQNKRHIYFFMFTNNFIDWDVLSMSALSPYWLVVRRAQGCC